jgi:tetratricopeptide (TPR) repeat protein
MTNPQFEMLIGQADSAARQNDWQGAADFLYQAERLDPQHVGVLTGIGTCALHLNRLPAAVSRFQQVTELAPDSPDAFNNLGVALALQGQYQNAETNYLKSLELDPENYSALKNLAQVCLQQDDRLQEGVQLLANLYQREPQDADVTFMLGTCYEGADDWDSAYEMYKQTLDMMPDHPQAKAGLERVMAQRSSLKVARPEHVDKLNKLKGLNKNRN